MLRAKRLTFVFLLGAISAAILLVGYAVYAWTGPTATAPASNVAAPINTGASGQVKTGDFATMGKFGVGLVSPNAKLNVSGGDIIVDGQGYIRSRYSGTTDSYRSSFGWNSIQLGNNGTNYIIAGNTAAGGSLSFVVNNSNEYTYGGAAPNGSTVLSLSSGGAYQNGNLRLDADGGWIRTYGVSGWYNGTYGGGWYMADSTWIRNYNNRPVYLDSYIYATTFYDTNNGGYYLDPASSNRTYSIVSDYIYSYNYVYGSVFYDSGNSGYYMVPRSGSRMNYIYADAYYYASDARLKKDVKPLENSLWKLLQLEGVSFTWNEESGDRAGEHDIGVIAQEVEKIMPEAVHTEEDGTKLVNYPKLTPLLINAIKEQQGQIDALTARIEVLEAHK